MPEFTWSLIASLINFLSWSWEIDPSVGKLRSFVELLCFSFWLCFGLELSSSQFSPDVFPILSIRRVICVSLKASLSFIDFINSYKVWAIVETCSSRDVVLVIMTSMANELTEQGEFLSLEVGIFSEKENLEPSGDLFSSSIIGTSWIGSEVWDKAGWDNISLTRPATSLLTPCVDEAIYDFWASEVLKTSEGWGMGVVWA